jgi:hypothetical protein
MRKLIVLALLAPTIVLAQPAKQAQPAQPAQPAKQPPPPAEPTKPAAPPPEIKAVVDAFKGNWTYDATITATGADKPAKFKITFNCKSVAGGAAVACDGKAKTPQGPWNASFLIAYDPYSKSVHFDSVTNNYEVNNRVCQWKGTDLECAPIKSGTGPTGDEVTEETKIHFDKRTSTFTSTTKSKSGSTIVFEGKGKK